LTFFETSVTQSVATSCKNPRNWLNMYTVMTGDSGNWSHRYSCAQMRLLVLGNCILVFVVQIAVRLVEGLICLIVVPHTVVVFMGYSALINAIS
jgi:hypothetical protein